MTDQSPNVEPAAPVPATTPKRFNFDVDGLAAFLVAGVVAGLVMYFKPDGPALTLASTVVGGCLLYIKGRS